MNPSELLSINARNYIEGAVATCIDLAPDRLSELTHAVEGLITYLSPETPLTHADIFHELTIEQYLGTLTELHPESKSDLRATLFRMRAVLLGAKLKLRQPTATLSNVHYSLDEQDAIKKWAAARARPEDFDADALLGLALGAGLTAKEIVNVRVEDVAYDAELRLTVIADGAKARRVRVDQKWVPHLERAWEEGGHGDWLFRDGGPGQGYRLAEPRNFIRDFVADSPDVGLRPEVHRMRATFLGQLR